MNAKNQEVINLFPRWIAPIYNESGGQDFLGLRAVQTRITTYLLPGIITITPRARYYAFYSWLLMEYSQSHPEDMSLAAFIKQREQIFVLANLAWNEASGGKLDDGGLQGSIKLRKHWKAHAKENFIPLHRDDYLNATYGGYGPYTGVMRTLGLTSQEDSNVVKVLTKGQNLASAFSEAIADTEYYTHRRAFDTSTGMSREVLEEYGSRCHLSLLDQCPDGSATLEVLFAFDADAILPPPEASSSVANMKGTLALILDMIDQKVSELEEDDFRQFVAYGLCHDYPPYQPAKSLRPFVAHWQMYQIREYFVYAMYALWTYFLFWLRLNGPQTLNRFDEHLNETIILATVAEELGVTIPAKASREWSLQGWLNAVLDMADIQEENWVNRCKVFAQKADFPMGEHRLYGLLEHTQPNQPEIYVGAAWLLLSAVYLRLCGLREFERWGAWHWTREGGVARRSLALFLKDIDNHLSAESCLHEVWTWLHREYIVTQHTLVALEKWRQRGSNTFHFAYEDGVFNWQEDGDTGLTAPRFRQAYDMLRDLGLYTSTSEGHQLTTKGRKTLLRSLESCNG